MELIDFIKKDTNVSVTISVSDLMEVINYTVTATRKELEQVITNEKSEVYWSAKEISKMLRVSTTTLWRWQKIGYLIPIEVGGLRKYRKSDIEKVCFNKGLNLN